MVKNIITLFFLILFFLACTFNNQYGLNRVIVYPFKLKPNRNDLVYKMIDTTASYKYVYYVWDSVNVIKKYMMYEDVRLLFYPNGKVGLFYDYNSPTKVIDYDPSKAVMGYYEYRDGVLHLEFLRKSPQAGNFRTMEVVMKCTDDTLISAMKKIPQGGGYKIVYVRTDLPKGIKKLKPDW